MSSKHLGGDINFAWPNVEIAVMGPEGAVNIIYRRELAAAENPDELRSQLTSQYRSETANPYIAASNGYLDDIILPIETRTRIIDALESLRNKRQKTPARKHGNIPL
jgi:acetyl-CoA carboxylase carboxyltransferase component